MQKNINDTSAYFTPTEWKLMECLWEQSPRTGREAVDWMSEHSGWTRSTTLTMLRRMTEKQVIACDVDENGIHIYRPLIRREDAAQRETTDFLGRVYSGSVSLLVSAMTKKQKLSRREIDELYAILRSAEEEADDD